MISGRRLALAAGAVVAVAMLLVAGGASYEVLARGHLLDVRPDLDVLHVELLGVELYLPERLESWADELNGIVLGALAAVAGFTALLLARGGTVRRELRGFFVLVSVGAAIVALDELLELSEAVQLNVEAELGKGTVSSLVGEIDAAIYVGLALVFLVRYRSLLRASAAALPWLAIGASLALLSFVLDIADAASSEALEVVASAALLVGFARLALELSAPTVQTTAVT